MQSLQEAKLITIGGDAMRDLMKGCEFSAEIEKCLVMCDSQDPTTDVIAHCLKVCNKELDGDEGYKARLQKAEEKIRELSEEYQQLNNDYSAVQSNYIKTLGSLLIYSTKLKTITEEMQQSHNDHSEEFESNKRAKK